MFPDDPLRWCRRCWPNHVENCRDCLGFGVRAGIPMTADAKGPREPCPTCGTVGVVQDWEGKT